MILVHLRQEGTAVVGEDCSVRHIFYHGGHLHQEVYKEGLQPQEGSRLPSH